MNSGRWVYAATAAVPMGTTVRIAVTTVDHPGLPACLQVYLHRQTQAGGPAKVVVTARDGSTGSPQACRATRAAWRRRKT